VQDRLQKLILEYESVATQLIDPDVVTDQKRYIELSRRFKHLEAIVGPARESLQVDDDIAETKEMIVDASGAERAELREMLDESTARQAELTEDLKLLLLPKDPNDGKNVIVEIRGAEGGEEANLFARDLYEMYLSYASNRGWKVELLGSHPSDMGGVQDVAFMLKGEDAWTRVKHEGGPHRVQRVPSTESQGRVHTSSAAVTVLPEADEVDVTIDPSDLQVDYFRSSGPGGQSVNTTDSACRITHKPTGTVVSMQDEKSQLQNKAKALRVLRARLLKLEEDRHTAEMSAARKDQVGGGGRSEKIRTYNFKENRVTDHRIGLTIYKLDAVLGGDLDEVIDGLLADERARQLQEEAAS
jgi:peptide chain release factor 1